MKNIVCLLDPNSISKYIERRRGLPWNAMDGSFKSTARFFVVGVYYAQALHLLAINPSNTNQTPMACTCATILMREIKPDHTAYERALDALNAACIEKYGIGIFHDRRVDVMTDMEDAIRKVEGCEKKGWKDNI